ncbi:Ribose-5-phosphate isomerase [Hondaea fermentalgiana]|uniref:ribose-5-phosphate isomerase n=1 Tax=Hondaea fermentalgiana TaxID=2315210 RepID=A0A2R5G929_9STRA|nr:Ribose-5-phosphate isomerase [Hondaea fermentalgiana]|eukprot:GBG27562.1 Ribose-5-phosphate isomerase [Hondaea fermentalgiana]
MAGVEKAKDLAARAAVDEFVKDGMAVGIGSGSTIAYGVVRLAERVKEEGLKVVCVPTSFQAKQLITENNLPLSDLENHPQLDVAIDGADEVDDDLNLIKGGGGCQTQEKIVASCAKTLVICADYRKDSKALGEAWLKGIPIEVIPIAYVPIMAKLKAMSAETVTLRMAKAKAGPCVTDNGNLIIDAHFGQIKDPAKLEAQLNGIPGVVCTGLFVGMAVKVFFGQEDGSVTTRTPRNAGLSA